MGGFYRNDTDIQLKTYSINVGGKEGEYSWGYRILIDTENQAFEVSEALKMYYGNDLKHLEIDQYGELIKKVI